MAGCLLAALAACGGGAERPAPAPTGPREPESPAPRPAETATVPYDATGASREFTARERYRDCGSVHGSDDAPLEQPPGALACFRAALRDGAEVELAAVDTTIDGDLRSATRERRGRGGLEVWRDARPARRPEVERHRVREPCRGRPRRAGPR